MTNSIIPSKTDETIDLGGDVVNVSRLTLSPKHTGVTFRDGTISFLEKETNPHYGMIEFVQGRTWNGVSYPPGDIYATFQNVIFDGGFNELTDFQDHNVLTASRQRKNISLLTTITNEISQVNFINCTFRNCGGSAWAGSGSVNFYKCKAENIVQHVAGCRAAGGVRVYIDGLDCNNCGSAWDLTFPVKTFRNLLNPDIAVISNVSCVNMTGRTKVASANWHLRGNSWSATQKPYHPNYWAAFDFPNQPISAYVEDVSISNWWACGIATLTDPEKTGVSVFKNLRVANSLRAAKVQQRVIVDGGAFTNVHSRYQSGSAIETGIVSDNALLNATERDMRWAGVVKAILKIYDDFNLKNGTNYRPQYWIPDSIKGYVSP